MLYIIISIGFITRIEKSYTYSRFRYAIVSDLRGRGKEKNDRKNKTDFTDYLAYRTEIG